MWKKHPTKLFLWNFHLQHVFSIKTLNGHVFHNQSNSKWSIFPHLNSVEIDWHKNIFDQQAKIDLLTNKQRKNFFNRVKKKTKERYKSIWKISQSSKYGDAPSGKIMNEMSNPVKDFSKPDLLVLQQKGRQLPLKSTHNLVQWT